MNGKLREKRHHKNKKKKVHLKSLVQEGHTKIFGWLFPLSLLPSSTFSLAFSFSLNLCSWLALSCLTAFPQAWLVVFCPSALWGERARGKDEKKRKKSLEAGQQSSREATGEERVKNLKRSERGQQSFHSSMSRR